MVSRNERQQRLPQRDMFDDGHGKFQFYDGICAYLQGMTTRSCANIFTPHGGGAGSNNATEAQNKVSHQQMPIRRHPVTHISEMLANMHTISRRDVSFNDWFRRDMWHHDLFLAVWHLMHFVAFPTDVACPAINVMHLATAHSLLIDRLDPAGMAFTAADAEVGVDRVLQMDDAMRKEPMMCWLLPTYKTLQAMLRDHGHLFRQMPKDQDAAGVRSRLRGFLVAPCTTPTPGPSWTQQGVDMFNADPAVLMEHMNLQEWLDRTSTFAVLVPLTDTEDVRRYLKRFERGIPIDNKGSHRRGNGCTVHYDKVGPSGIFYCLCPDHSLRGVCAHIVLFLVDEGIVEPPLKWSCERIAGPSARGRAAAFVSGSALLADPLALNLLASRHALPKVSRAVQRSAGGGHAQAMVACMGTIKLESDSVRKYTEGKHTSGARQDKSATDDKKQGKRKNKKTPSKQKRRSAAAGPGAVGGEAKKKKQPKGKKPRVDSAASDADSAEAMAARSLEENSGERPKRAKGDAQQCNGAAQEEQGRRGVRGKGKAGPGKVAGKSGLTWAQSAEKYIMLLGFARQPKQDKINLLRIMVVGEAHDGVRAAVAKALEVQVPDLQELGRLLAVME